MYIIAKFQVEGLHQWMEAPNYLKYPHRHIFVFNVRLSVDETNREVEFIDFSRRCKNEVVTWFPDMDRYESNKVPSFSCEQLGLSLLEKIAVWYPKHDANVTVEEDGENGAFVELKDLKNV